MSRSIWWGGCFTPATQPAARRPAVGPSAVCPGSPPSEKPQARARHPSVPAQPAHPSIHGAGRRITPWTERSRNAEHTHEWWGISPNNPVYSAIPFGRPLDHGQRCLPAGHRLLIAVLQNNLLIAYSYVAFELAAYHVGMFENQPLRNTSMHGNQPPVTGDCWSLHFNTLSSIIILSDFQEPYIILTLFSSHRLCDVHVLQGGGLAEVDAEAGAAGGPVAGRHHHQAAHLAGAPLPPAGLLGCSVEVAVRLYVPRMPAHWRKLLVYNA